MRSRQFPAGALLSLMIFLAACGGEPATPQTIVVEVTRVVTTVPTAEPQTASPSPTPTVPPDNVPTPPPAEVAEHSGPLSDELTLRLSDGAALYIPPNAMSGSHVRLARLDNSPAGSPSMPEGAVALSSFYVLDADADHLDLPVTVVLPYDRTPLAKLGIGGPAVEDGMYLAFPQEQGWKRVYGVVNQEQHTFTALLTELQDPLLMWDFYADEQEDNWEAAPWIEKRAIELNGAWTSIDSQTPKPTLSFHMSDGAVQIDQPIKLGLLQSWTKEYEDCAASQGAAAGDAYWRVSPALSLSDGRRLPLNIAQTKQERIRRADVQWASPPSNSQASEVLLSLAATPLSTAPESITAVGLTVSLKGIKLLGTKCYETNSIEAIYFELPLSYVGSAPGPDTATPTAAPPPTTTPISAPPPTATPTIAPTPTVAPPPPTAKPTEAQAIGMPNPASVYCHDKGYTLEIRKDAGGNEYGVCIFPDGTECEEWAFYRGTCAPGGEVPTPTPTPVPPQSFYEDSFDGSSLNSGVWTFGTNSGGSGNAVADGVLRISGGQTNGGGAWVLSKKLVTPSDQTQVFETRLRTSKADRGYWGFWGDKHEGYLAFGIDENSHLVAWARPNSTASLTTGAIAGVNATEWHTYRIEFTSSQARFYVDGDLKATLKQGIPAGKAMHVRLDRPSVGENQTLDVDFVRVSK